MIQKIHLKHQLNKETIDKINTTFLTKEALNKPFYTDGYESSFFIISFQKDMNINSYHMDTIIDYPYFNCKYEYFASALYKKYHEIFGDDIISEIPRFDECFCTYVEYTTFIKTNNAKQAIEELKTVHKREYIDRKLWNNIDVKENEITFLLHQKNSYHLQALAKCYGTVLIKMDQTITGDKKEISVNNVVSLETERSVFEKMITEYFYPAGLLDCKISDALLKKAVFVAPIENDKTVNEIVDTLPINEHKKALLFLNLGEIINLIAKTRYSSSSRCWKCSWHLKNPGKPSRVLFTIDFQRENILVKANLSHLNNYIGLMEEMPERIQQVICKGYDCKQCNTNCGSGWPFTFHDKQYLKCTGLNFIFTDLSEDEYDSVASLILKESDC